MAFRSIATVLIAATCVSCASLGTGVDGSDVESLLYARDYFALRDRLESFPESPERIVAEATVLNAFNEPGASNAAIDEVLSEADLTEQHRLDLLRLRRDNLLRLHHYDRAYEAARSVLDLEVSSLEKRRDDQNIAVFLRALRGVPPQTVEIRRDSHIQPNAEGHIPLRIDGQDRAFAIDTGANFSVLMRSEAIALGLDVRRTGVEVGTSTDVNMLADLAVADSLTIGNMQFDNVVFLVFSDHALTFPNGFEIRGLIGFPVMEAMREIHFHRDGSVRVPAEPTVEPRMNLALDGLDPLIKVRWGSSDLLCRLDSGANTTDFYEPFYRKYGVVVERRGRRHRSRTGGIGGVREFEVILIPRMRIAIGERMIQLENVDVLTQPLVAEASNYLDCNIGRDVLQQFGEYALNFESMSLVLR